MSVKHRLDVICSVYRAIYAIEDQSQLQLAEREAALEGPRKQARDRINELNKHLSMYTTALQAKESSSPLAWIALSLKHFGDEAEFILKIQSGKHIVRMSEGVAVRILIQLAEEGKLGSLRLCEQCHAKWMIPLRQMDRFCSAACRIKNRLSSDWSKQRQRLNQKAYRDRLRAKDARIAPPTGLALPTGKRTRPKPAL